MSTAAVYVVLPDGDEILAGQVTADGTPWGGVSFRYDSSYLTDARGYALSPDMPLTAGPIRPSAGRRSPGAIADATPDSWGRRVIRAAHRPTTEFDYLTAVADPTRHGALRFHNGTHYLADRSHPAAQVHDLERVLVAARAIESGTETDDDLRILVGAGTSAGGARPKATVSRGGALWMAKFSRDTEHNDPMAWEATALTLASQAGIVAAEHDLHRLSGSDSILLTRRFDRDGERRVGYLSAHSLTEKADDIPVSYAALADVLRVASAAPNADLEDLFRRVAVNLLVGNVDDHFRNHGLLRTAAGWRLSPAFDIEPNLQPERVEATPLVDGGSGFERSTRELLASHDAYGLSEAAAGSILRDVAERTNGWRDVAAAYGISPDTFPSRSKTFDGENRTHALGLPSEPSTAGRDRGKTTPGSNRGSFRARQSPSR